MRTLVGLIVLLSLAWTPSSALPQAPAAVPAAAPAAVPASLEPNPAAPLYRHTGEQYRVYNFPETGESIPYRLFVPTTWTPARRLPMLVTLRAGTSVDNPYRPPNSLVSEAARRGYVVVTPMGYRPLRQPYYGSRYRIARADAAEPAAGWTAEEDARAEQDVLNVIELVTKDTTSTPRAFICTARIRPAQARCTWRRSIPTGSRRSSSARPDRVRGLPVGSVKGKGLLVIHGDQDTVNPIAASQRMAEAARAAGVDATYATVPGGTHLEAYLTYARGIFDFLDAHR